MQTVVIIKSIMLGLVMLIFVMLSFITLSVVMLGVIMPLLANNSLSCKGLPLPNTLAYCKHLLITDVKRFITLGPCPLRKYWTSLESLPRTNTVAYFAPIKLELFCR
jgi:hypothetical protein